MSLIVSGGTSLLFGDEASTTPQESLGLFNAAQLTDGI